MTVLDGVDEAAAQRTSPGRSAPERTAAGHRAVDRAALARAVLARAEQRTGARSARRRVGAVPGSPPAPGLGAGTGTDAGPGRPTSGAGPAPGRAWTVTDAAPGSPAAPGTAVPGSAAASGTAVPGSAAASGTAAPATGASAAAVHAVAAPTVGGALTHPDRPPLPVAPSLAGLLPEGALRRGSSLVVTGSTSLLLALLARASQEGSWVAVVGLPAVGLLAAQQAGVVLDRLALVPRPGPDAPTVLAALVDGVDLVVVGDDAALADHDRRRLTARARERGTVLMSTTSWPGAHVVLAAEPAGWTGLGAGHGHLRRNRLRVTRGGRGSAGRGVRAEVVLPVRPDAPGARPAVPARDTGAPPVPLRRVG